MLLTRSLLSSTKVSPVTGAALLKRCYATPPPNFNINEHKQFIVFGYDGKDDKALERRMAARPSHMVRAKQLKKQGKLLYGGAILDRNGKMIGSVMLMNDMTEQETKKCMEEDPYVKDKAWETYEIKPFRLADLD